MDDESNLYQTTTSVEPEKTSCGGGEWIWAILFFIALLIIAGLIIWLVLSYRRNTKGTLLQLTNPLIEVTSNTQITGSWKSTGNASDKVTLFATLEPPIYNDAGNVTNPNALSSTASGEAASVTINGLQQNLKYYATLILRNDNTNNYQVYNQTIFTQISTLPAGTLLNNSLPFTINDMLQIGNIEYITGTAPFSTQFNQLPIENNLWYYNANGQIQSNNENVCLFNLNGKLIAQDCSASPTDNSDSKWTYNPSKNPNKWCLSSTITNANPTCMVLGNITKGKAPITVTNTSTVGDSWALNFQNPT